MLERQPPLWGGLHSPTNVDQLHRIVGELTLGKIHSSILIASLDPANGLAVHKHIPESTLANSGKRTNEAIDMNTLFHFSLSLSLMLNYTGIIGKSQAES